MSSDEIDRRYWRGAIRRGDVTFFTGAGISAAPPSNLPLATGLVASLIDPVLRPLGLPAVLARTTTRTLIRLRPEVITDVLLEHLGIDAARPILHALHGRPNAWHFFLAAALGAGCNVITTNFDTLIEKACDALGVGIGKDRSILFKIHGSLGHRRTEEDLSSVALAVRQVGRGLSAAATKRLQSLIERRPLIVVGYSGRDDFDILPALIGLRRTAPGLWIIHRRGEALRTLTGAARRRAESRPALVCATAWPGSLDTYTGESGDALDLLRPNNRFGRPRVTRTEPAPRIAPWLPPPETAAVAMLYALVEARAFALAARLFAHIETRHMPARLLAAQAVVLEKHGTDLRAAAEVARQARAASNDETPAVRALVLDQSGVIARRRGLYSRALRFYDQALRISTRSKCPAWLVIQIRSHRAVALEYLERRADALREHRRVAAYEKRTGDLRGYAKSLNNIGIVQMNLRRWKAAIVAFERSNALKRDLGDHRGIAQTLHNLGKLHYLRGDSAAAERTFLESLRLRAGRGRDEHGVAQSFIALAYVARQAGEPARAAEYARRALHAHRRFGDQRGIAQARQLLRSLEAEPMDRG